MGVRNWARVALAATALGLAWPLLAQTTIYRCTDAKGEMTVQNAPCPAGTKEDKRQVGEVASRPLPSSLRNAPAPAAASTAPPARSVEAAPVALPAPSGPPPAPLHLSATPDPTVTPPAPTGPATTIYRCTDATGALTVQNSPCPAGSKTDKRAVQGVASMPLPGNRPAAAAATPATAVPAAQAAAPTAAQTAPFAAPAAARQGGERARDSAIVPAADDTQMLQTIPGMTLIQDPTLHKDDAAADALAGRKPAQANQAAAGLVTGSAPPILFQCTTYDSGTYLTEEANPQSRCAPLNTVGLDGNPAGGAGRACEVIHDVCARVPDQRLCAAWNKRLGEAEVAWRYAKPENQADRKADYDRVQRIVTDAHCK